MSTYIFLFSVEIRNEVNTTHLVLGNHPKILNEIQLR